MGALIRGDSGEPVRSEPGDWPAFYAGVEAAPRSGSPPPVDPRGAVEVLRILEQARLSDPLRFAPTPRA